MEEESKRLTYVASPFPREKLASLYGVDVIAAAASSAMVAPFISVVDRAIIENANGKRPLGQGLVHGFKMVLTEPHRFVRTPQFQLIFGVYFSTYITANITDTTCEAQGVAAGTASWYKFVATSVTNMTLCIFKDREFTRMFGTTASRRLPILSYVFFAIRDSMTVAASFNAPRYVAEWLQQRQILSSSKDATVAAQLACPAFVQFCSTPFHLLGLDLYNRPGATVGQRLGFLRREYLKSAFARIGRIGPAFGIGGVGNTYFRSFRNNLL